MAKPFYRRSADDKQWQDTKQIVFNRDDSCRLLKVLDVLEALTLKKRAGHYIQQLDAAHYLPVGEYGEYCYDPDNIVALNHYSHGMLDDYRNPITGKSISKEEVDEWWMRILKGNPDQYRRLIEKGIIKE